MKRLISLTVSLAILGFIYWQIDAGAMLKILQGCNVAWLVASLAMVIPLTAITAWRFQQLMPPQVRISFVEATRLILAASSLNMVLPSKMGEIAKAWFMRGKGGMDGRTAVSLVVFEKSCDMLSLLLWCALGLIIYPDKNALFWLFAAGILAALIAGFLFIGSAGFLRISARLANAITPRGSRDKLAGLWTKLAEIQAFFWSNKTRGLKILSISLFIWFLHLLQIWWFTLALKASVPFLSNLAIAPLTILAGLVPLTFAGVGTRDAAAILLYQPFFAAPTGAALGLLLTTRYLMPAIAGLPFLNHYLMLLRTGPDSQRATVS